MSAAAGLASIHVEKTTPADMDELRSKVAQVSRRAFLTPILITALLAVAAGFAGGFAAGFFVRTPSSSASTEIFDVDSEIEAIQATCTSSDLNGDEDIVSEPCLHLVTERVRALERLVHTHPHSAAHFANATRSIASRRKLWGEWGGSNEPACDGEWTGSCCRNNRPGPATGPSPLCRAGVMNSCECDPITGECQREYYECSWWNGFCWLFCRSYDEVKYCNYCGNPSE